MSEASATNAQRRSKELSFSVNGLRLTAKTWGDPMSAPTFALHGWLDNANSFDRLAPLLPELDLVALDFAGHGFSSHRPAGVHYTSLLDVQVRGGYTWRTDRRIRFRTPQRLSNDQLDALMQRSTAPSLLIIAEQGDQWYRPGIERRVQQHPALTVERLDGPHHLHLEAQAARVAALIRGFLSGS